MEPTGMQRAARGALRRRAERLGALVATLVSLPTLADAQVRCGDVIRAGETVVLQRDLVCDDVDEALVLDGAAVLDLNGFAVRCEDRDGDGDTVVTGVLLEGAGAILRGGAVRGCRQPVGLRGEGHHTVSNVTVAFASSDGVRIESEHNTVVDSSAFFCEGAGFAVQAGRNVLTGNVATGNEIGFDVADRSRLERNTAASSDLAGFLVRARRAVLVGNRAIGNATGYLVPGIANRIQGNTAEDNDTGLFLENSSRRNVVQANVVEDSTFNGFAVDGEANRLLQNRAQDNGGNGIRTSSRSRRIVVRGTVARRNARGDLFENVPDCGSNRWRNNEFASRNQDCIE